MDTNVTELSVETGSYILITEKRFSLEDQVTLSVTLSKLLQRN